jgi:hypothetical protein
MKRLVHNALAVSALAAGLSLVATPAFADVFLDYTVVETVVPGADPAVLDPVDKINGAYSERITFDGLGGFETHAIADFTQYLNTEGGNPISSQLNVPPPAPGTCGGLGQPVCPPPPTPNQYGIYAIFTSEGTVAGGPGIFTFAGGTGSVRVFIDPLLDTSKTLGATGGSAPIIANDADDLEILFANDLDSGFGILVAGIGGFFDLVFRDPTLTAFGATYWTNLPPPGTFRANIDGDFDTFVPAGTLTLTGDVSNVFIPEPATLALLGSGLFAAGVAARRRRKAQQ